MYMTKLLNSKLGQVQLTKGIKNERLHKCDWKLMTVFLCILYIISLL